MILDGEDNSFPKGFKEWYDSLSDEEKANMRRKCGAHQARIEGHPLFRKAREILRITETIVTSLPEEEQSFHGPMVASALILGSKFAGVCNSDMWLLTMQSAAIVRYHAEYITTGTYGFNLTEPPQVDERYIELLRKEMKEYKQLFNEWMQTVHAMPRDPEMDADEWGVFVRA